jgi:hypothetical protein
MQKMGYDDSLSYGWHTPSKWDKDVGSKIPSVTPLLKFQISSLS